MVGCSGTIGEMSETIANLTIRVLIWILGGEDKMSNKAVSSTIGGAVAGGATAAFLGTSGSIGVAGALPLLAATGIGLPVAAVIGVAIVGGALATAGAHGLVEDAVASNGNSYDDSDEPNTPSTPPWTNK